jgi:hypothetical protein
MPAPSSTSGVRHDHMLIGNKLTSADGRPAAASRARTASALEHRVVDVSPWLLHHRFDPRERTPRCDGLLKVRTSAGVCLGSNPVML